MAACGADWVFLVVFPNISCKDVKLFVSLRILVFLHFLGEPCVKCIFGSALSWQSATKVEVEFSFEQKLSPDSVEIVLPPMFSQNS